MKKILLFLLISNFLYSQWSISNAERNALIALYNATDGEHWSQTWDVEKDPKTWYGIKVKNSSVSEINLRGNVLKGNFPSNLSAFSKLEKLDLSSNQLEGEISSGISGITTLTRLDTSNNRLSGDPSLTLASLTNLEELSLGNNNFVLSDVNGFLQNFTKIKILDLSHFGLTEVPQKISTYTNLEVLALANNTISGNFGAISGLSKLTELDFSGNNLSQIPSQISSVTSLKTLNLSNNLFAQNYSAPLSALTNLEWLSLENNLIETFPTELAQLQHLVHLNFGRNKISGGISSLTSLQNLEQLFLNNNLFSGAFPTELLQLSRLQMLSLNSNNFTGSIPQNIPAITHIENNRFTESQIENFWPNQESKADFEYSPQRYDEPTIVLAALGGSANLTQSLSGNDYQFAWFKTLDQNISVNTPNYLINPVELDDFDFYTCEAYFLKDFGQNYMEVSFFREPITLERTLATDEVSKLLNIFPNPTKDYLNISAKNIKVEFALIYDLSGKLLLQTSDATINVKSFPTGTYLISIKTEKGIKTFKWIKL